MLEVVVCPWGGGGNFGWGAFGGGIQNDFLASAEGICSLGHNHIGETSMTGAMGDRGPNPTCIVHRHSPYK
jgi:hypothetical protein